MKHLAVRFLPLVAFGFLALASARADGKAGLYVAPGELDPVALLAPPPAPGSAEDAVDLDTTYRVYSSATPEEHARAADEVKLTVFHFAPVVGAWFVSGKFPKTEALFQQVHVEAKAVAKVGKEHWKRLRPYHVDPVRFPHAIEKEDRTDYSYPSGHSTRGTVFALVLAELFPGQREELLAKGRDTGWLRVQGGVHYPTDVYAGRVLGQALAHVLFANPRFQHDLAEARAELVTLRPR